MSGTIVVLGTPAEEGGMSKHYHSLGGGKIELIKKGAMQGIDIAMMTHPYVFGNQIMHLFQDMVYNSCLAMQELRVNFFGKATHASASPWEGINALVYELFVLKFRMLL